MPKKRLSKAKPVADLETIEKELAELPASSGVLLMVTGTVGGLCVPGLPGLGIALLGGMIAAPRMRWLRGADEALKEHAPEFRAEALRFVHRYFQDLHRRFPRRPKKPTP